MLENDRRTDVVLAYLEDIRDGRRFVEAARSLTLVKPLVLLKPGTTEAGAGAAKSHTGALTGSNEAAEAAFRRAGVTGVDSIQELFDVTMAFSHAPLPKGGRVAIVTNAGGPGVVTADAVAETDGLAVAELSEISSISSNRLRTESATPGLLNRSVSVPLPGCRSFCSIVTI